MANPVVPKKATEYGLLMFDVPVSRPYLYTKVRKAVGKCCIPVNLSVYMFDWGLKNSLDISFQNMNAYKEASVHMIKFDPSEINKLEELANKQLEIVFSKINFRLQQALKDASSSKEKEKALSTVEKRLQGYERLLVLYDFTNKVQPSLDILKKIVVTQFNLIKGAANGTNQSTV